MDLSSPIGGSFPSNSRFAFCSVYAVDAENRSCSIKTYGSDNITSDQDYPNVQWLSSYTSPDGDEVSLIPRLGSQGLCVFLDGQPWIVGFFQPMSIDNASDVPDPNLEGNEPKGATAAINKEKINSGDFIQRTRAGSRIVMRAGGEIEIESTPVCKRTYFPTENRINENSYNYEFRTNGGTIDWIQPDPLDPRTECTTVWRDDIEGTNIIIDERGTVEVDTDYIWRYRMGAGSDFITIPTTDVEAPIVNRPRVLEQMSIDGTREYFLKQPDPEDTTTYAYESFMGTDGEWYVGINDYSYYTQIQPTGEMRININDVWQHRVLPDGETQIDIGMTSAKEEGIPGEGSKGKMSLNVKPTGDIVLDVNAKNLISVSASGEVKIDIGPGKSVLTIDQGGNVKVEATTKMEVTAPDVNLLASNIKLGSATSDVVPMGKLLLAAVNKFIGVFNGHSHSGIPIVVVSGPPTAPAEEITADVLSATVKVQP